MLLLLIIPAFILNILVMSLSGTTFCLAEKCGMHFWGVNSHDAMWHLEIAAVSFRQFPFAVPTFAGAELSGYNILMDLGIYLISLVGIPPVITLFKIIPIIWFVAYTAVLITLSRKIHDSKLFVGLVLFVSYFAGHLGYLLQIYHNSPIFGGSQSFALQSATILLNTQLALSLPFLFYLLILIKEKKFDLKSTWIFSLVVALIISLKFYGGVIAIFFGAVYFFESYFQKKQIVFSIKQGLILVIPTLIAVILFYNPFLASKSGSVFIFAPFSIVHSMIEEANMVYLPDMVNARYFLYENDIYSPRLLFIELFSTFIYIVLNFGTRIFGLGYVLYRIIRRTVTKFEIYIFLAIILSVTLSVALIQKGDWWNTVQFSYYGIFLSNILLALFLYQLIKKKNILLYLIALLIILLTIPQNVNTIQGFTSKNTTYISREELEALAFLKDQPNGVVYNSFLAREGYSFYDYRNSGYVSAFTNKQLYLAHIGPLKIIGVDPSERIKKVEEQDCSVLSKIDYIYFVTQHEKGILDNCQPILNNTFQEIFSNSEILIYKKL